MKPSFKHDCNACFFVRNVNGFDMYLCNGSIIARYGSDGSDYVSMPIHVFITMWKDNVVVRVQSTDVLFREYVAEYCDHYLAMARVLALKKD